MIYRGRPIVGAIFGLVFGVFVTADLAFFKVSALPSTVVLGVPAAGLLLGVLLALWAPFGRKRARPANAPRQMASGPPGLATFQGTGPTLPPPPAPPYQPPPPPPAP